MKRIIFAIALLLATVSTGAKGPKKITILHTSDTHSCILPLNKNLADTLVADRGGFLRKTLTCCCSTAATSRRAPVTIPCSRATWRWD